MERLSHGSKDRRGWIEVICGGMFSGKTEELIRRIRSLQHARRKVLIFVPAMDTRYQPETIVSHNGSKLSANPVRRVDEILKAVESAPDTEVVAIDEIQFLEDQPDELVAALEKLALSGLRVIAVGLDQDFRGKPFPPIPDLLAVAEDVTKLLAICPVCGEPAGRSQRFIDGEPAPMDSPTVVVGGAELYEPRCRIHHITSIR